MWKGDLESARFLVYAGCELRHESWLALPGKTPAQDRLLAWLRDFSRQPRSLLHGARQAVRLQLSLARNDMEILSAIAELPVPPIVKKYLEFQGEKELLQ